jgi:hypothetical protein
MPGGSPELESGVREQRFGPAPVVRGRHVRYLLPLPVSVVHALAVLIAGFAVEGGTEAYQFLERGSLGQGWFEYYSTLATTILGFYLMFLGLREWHAFHPKPAKQRRIPWLMIQLFASAFISIGLWIGLHSRRVRQKYFLPWMVSIVAATVALVVATVMVDRARATPRSRPLPWLGLGLWGGGTVATAALSIGLGGGGGGASPIWIAAPVGGIIVLAFGSFFLGLRKEVQPWASPAGDILGWGAFVWSLGVGWVAGLVVGDRAIQLLTEFFTNWSALIASIAPIVVAIGPLFVSYALIIGAFLLVILKLKDRIP